MTVSVKNKNVRNSLKLHHRKHTGKLIHHRHTSYWVLVLLLLVSTGTVMFIDRTVNADTLDVTATVPAPIPSDPAVFTSPSNNSQVSNASVVVAGNCPVVTPSIIVAIYSDTELLGSAICSNDGTFTSTLELHPGVNTLIARVVTITGQYGETSAPLTLTYAPASSPNTSVSLPTIQIERPFIAYRPGLLVHLKITVRGGVPPYTITIRWGDGSILAQALPSSGDFSFDHTFVAGTLNSQETSITIEDAADQSITRRLAATSMIASKDTTSFNFASLLDGISPSPAQGALIIYTLLATLLIFSWHFEHTHYKKRVGLPIHYSWQHKKHAHRP